MRPLVRSCARRPSAGRFRLSGRQGQPTPSPFPARDPARKVGPCLARSSSFSNSVGIGAAEDAAASVTPAPTPSAISPRLAPTGGGDREGLRAGPLYVPNLDRLGFGAAAEASRGAPLPDLGHSGPPEGLWGYGVEVSKGKDTPSGHWEIAGVPVPFDWGYFPETIPTFPEGTDRRADPRGEAPRHPRQQACVGDGDHRRARRGACPDRKADLLHLGRLGVPDRRARDCLRPRPALRGLRDRAPAGRPAQYRPGDRAALRRQRPQTISSAPPTAATTPCRRPSRRCSTAPSPPDAGCSPSARSGTSSPTAASPR